MKKNPSFRGCSMVLCNVFKLNSHFQNFQLRLARALERPGVKLTIENHLMTSSIKMKMKTKTGASEKEFSYLFRNICYLAGKH